MDCERRPQGSLNYLHLAGSLTGEDGPAMRKLVSELCRFGTWNLVWDLSELETPLEREGLLLLVEALTWLRAEGAPLILFCPPDELCGRLARVGLLDAAHVVTTYEEALEQVFRGMDRRYDQDFLQVLLRGGWVTQEQMGEALDAYKEGRRERPVDEILLEKGFLSMEELMKAAVAQKSFLGEILVESHVVSRKILDEVLKEQRANPDGLKLGDILLKYGIVTRQEIDDALSKQYVRKKVALGSGQADSYVDSLTVLRPDNHPLVRDAIDQIVKQGEKIVPELVERIGELGRPNRCFLAEALGEIGDARAVDELITCLASDDLALRDGASWALLRILREALPLEDGKKLRKWWEKKGPAREAKRGRAPRSRSFQELVTAISDGEVSVDDWVLAFESGKISWEGGRIGLLLFPSGRALLKRNCRGTLSCREGHVKESQVLDLVEVVLANSPDGTLIPWREDRSDDSMQCLTLDGGDFGRAHAAWQASEVYGNLRLMAIENAVKLMVKVAGFRGE